MSMNFSKNGVHTTSFAAPEEFASEDMSDSGGGSSSSTPPPKKRKSPSKNAFTFLMSSSSSKRKRPMKSQKRESNFVGCPNCGRFISFASINMHLDKCVLQEEAKDTATGSNEAKNDEGGVTAHVAVNNLDSTSESNLKCEGTLKGHGGMEKILEYPMQGSTVRIEDIDINSHGKKRKREENANEEINYQDDTAIQTSSQMDKRVPVQPPGERKPKENQTQKSSRNKVSPINAFSHLMQHSKRAYEEQSRKVEKHTFHLSKVGDEFVLQWVPCRREEEMDGNSLSGTTHESPLEENAQWSAKVMVRASKEEQTPEYGTRNKNDIELNISSSIPSDPPFERAPFVRNHSKLSVPVLKSILQKSIRRRRPLPSVRLAMELSDKSYGDLIRRLPIICLEDSFLHPDFPLLVWLMVADSKDFVAPRELLRRVMHIVFELASCPWKDYLSDDPASYDESSTEAYRLGLSMNKDPLHTNRLDSRDLMLHSMILRKKYGGMTCDKQMLDTYVSLWKSRFQRAKVDSDITARCFPSAGKEVAWEDVPRLIYSFDQNKKKNLEEMLNHQLPFLKMHDMALSGIDFHCSNVIDVLVKDTSSPFYTKLCNILGGGSREKVGNMAKTIMWEYSSGINYRRDFVEHLKQGGNDDMRRDSRLKTLWEEEASPIVKNFASSYVFTRLAKAAIKTHKG